MMGYGGYGMMGFGMLIPLILIVLIIYAVVRLANGNKPQDERYNERNEALNILNQRYAQGEISDEEYKKKKAMLKD